MLIHSFIHSFIHPSIHPSNQSTINQQSIHPSPTRFVLSGGRVRLSLYHPPLSRELLLSASACCVGACGGAWAWCGAAAENTIKSLAWERAEAWAEEAWWGSGKKEELKENRGIKRQGMNNWQKMRFMHVDSKEVSSQK